MIILFIFGNFYIIGTKLFANFFRDSTKIWLTLMRFENIMCARACKNCEKSFYSTKRFDL
ncbi:hypothetical protein HZS_1544 [Henneguya salminicola]|nr:hypothetical protein HZS_1544 [Henneguya salminicola]